MSLNDVNLTSCNILPSHLQRQKHSLVRNCEERAVLFPIHLFLLFDCGLQSSHLCHVTPVVLQILRLLLVDSGEFQQLLLPVVLLHNTHGNK